MDTRPIGVFDSGLGGLTVVREIIKLLPNENIIYLGDTARVPYGTRSKEIVTKFSLEDSEFLLQKKVKCIVVACNTASALASEILKAKFEIPVFEVITPAVEKALEVTKNNKVGVIGTRATISSDAYKKLLLQHNSYLQIEQTAAPLLVPFIEEAEIDGELIEKLVKKYLRNMNNANIDTLILGCTHYPIIEKIIAKEMGSRVKLINPGVEVAKLLLVQFRKHKILNENILTPTREYFVTDLTPRFLSVAELFLGLSISDKIKKVQLN